MACASTAITNDQTGALPVALMGATRGDVEALLQEHGQPKFRAKQLWHWLYWHGATSFEDMQTLPKQLREALDEAAHLQRPKEATVQQSVDGTRKWLLQFADGKQAETVFIPDMVEERGTLCISSQVGCTLTCAFCHTGTQKLVRNLTAAEIVQQFIVARDHLGEWPTPSNGVARRLSNVVMMGMGEPLYNYENVKEALKVLMDPEGLALSKRRITLSTSGVVPRMQQCGEEIGVNLAVSLHAVSDDVRDVLVPLNKKYPIKELLDACRSYPGTHNNRRITFEYVMIDGVNDSDADARELARLVEDIPAKINLIPFNPWPGTDYECSSAERITSFSQILNDKGLAAPVRTPRGRDILAACGQLKSASERAKGEKVKL